MKKIVSSPRGPQSGFALIIVLGVVVLMVALLIGFLSMVGSERTASFAYNASASVLPLANNTVSLVEGQINIATTQGSGIAWASQPGLVRTFDSSGNLKQAFKLYSSPSMILGSDAQALTLANLDAKLTTDIPPANWAAAPALWTDLNAPVLSSNGKASGVYTYPILDNGTGPSETSQISPQGFSVSSPPGATIIQPVPMPVQWLYQLKDGSLIAPDATSTTTATFANATSQPTSLNPIVGRIAFWTDDDTCKVNVNTAGEGTFWDVPRGATKQEQNLANYQPAKGEFQRYPGHPAMTSLSAVFGNLFDANANTNAEDIYNIVPRIVGGGSTEGTVIPGGALTTDADRLYDSVDELIFNSSRTANQGLTRAQLEQAKFFLTAHSRAPEVNLFNLPRVACWPIYALNAGAYDTNHTTVFDRLIGDCSTINGYPFFFQRQVNSSPTNDINILRNTQLYAYLQTLTSLPVPGYPTGANTNGFSSKYPGGERDQLLTEIFDYIRSTDLYDELIPDPNPYTQAYNNHYTGLYAAAGTPTMGPGHGWVAPSHYQPPNGNVMTMGFGRSPTLSQFGIGFICNADGNDTTYGSNSTTANPVPLLSKPNQILNGTALTSNQKCIQAIIVMELFSPMYGWTGMCPDIQVEITGLDGLSVTDSGGIPLSLGFPADGYTPYFVDVASQYGGRGWGGNMGWRYSLFSHCAPALGPLPKDTGSSLSAYYPFISLPVRIKTTSAGTMTFSGGTVTVKIYSGHTPLGTSSAPAPAANLMQTLSINLPAGTFPVPNLVTSGTSSSSYTTSPQNWWTFSIGGCVLNSNATPVANYPGRLNYVGASESFTASPTPATTVTVVNGVNVVSYPEAGIFFRNDSNFDVVRTVFPQHGDFRLVAGTYSVPSTVFQPHPYYGTSAQFMASNLTSTGGCPSDPGYDTRGTYFSSISYPAGLGLNPEIGYGTTQTPEATGDYDSALPRGVDGPFINKPDEGNVYALGSGIPYFGAANNTGVPNLLPTYFSPNRMMPSPGMFGSLSTGVVHQTPWQTLLFRPNVNTATPHPGSVAPEDNLLLDLFWMPVVQPYAISDRFSTAGKINMNYQIVPFNYITRSTGLQALLKGEQVSAIANTSVGTTAFNSYRSYSPPSPALPNFRNPIDSAKTLTQFSNKFTNSGTANFGDVFKSPSEICDQHIVPSGQTLAGMSTFWASNLLTGDNMRERIYTTLYPRLTTKSNSYTVHFQVQSLQQLTKDAAAGTWTEGADLVTAEYRGSTTLERYIDPNNTSIPNYAADAAAGSLASDPTLDTFYKWRVVENRQFAP